MEWVHTVLTAVHVLAAIAWIGGIIFHIVVLDPVFRKNEVDAQGAYLLALMERRFRKLVGTSIILLVGSGLVKTHLLLGSLTGLWTTHAGRYILLKIGVTAAMLGIFAVCPKTRSCSPIPGACDLSPGGLPTRGKGAVIRERSTVILPKVALVLGIAAMVTAVYLRG